MQNIDFSDLADLTTNAFYDIWDLAGDYGRDPKIYMHWSAGLYDTCFEDYHINITSDGLLYASTENLAKVKAHTYHRNSGAIGISMCCCYGATSESLGDYPPTAAQIAAYKAIAFAEEGKLEEAKPFFLEALLYEFSQLYSIIEPIGVEFLDLFYYGSTVYQNIQTYYPDTVDETFLGGIIDIFKDTPEALGKSICNYFRKENGKIQQVTAFGDIIIILKAMSESGEEKVFQIERYRLYDLLKHDENGYYVIEFENDDLDLFDSCFKGKSLEEFAKELHALFPKR